MMDKDEVITQQNISGCLDTCDQDLVDSFCANGIQSPYICAKKNNEQNVFGGKNKTEKHEQKFGVV